MNEHRRIELPTRHTLEAALHVAAIVDASGSGLEETVNSYWHRATGGLYSPRDLARAQDLLLAIGLLILVDDVLYPVPVLTGLLAGTTDDACEAILARCLGTNPLAHDDPDISTLICDGERRRKLIVGLGARFDDTHRRLVGDIGEDIVVEALRAQLEWVGRADLAQAVRRVSLISDQLGYDIEAPFESGSLRYIEVKSTAAEATQEALTIFLSRNEAETGMTLSNWFLVVCRVMDIENRSGDVLGWCTATDLAEQLPVDQAEGLWQSVRMRVDRSSLRPGLPT